MTQAQRRIDAAIPPDELRLSVMVPVYNEQHTIAAIVDKVRAVPIAKEIRFQATLVKPGGDVITAIAGRKVTRRHDLSELISRFRPGETVTVDVLRGSDRRQVRVKLGERPSDLPE